MMKPPPWCPLTSLSSLGTTGFLHPRASASTYFGIPSPVPHTFAQVSFIYTLKWQLKNKDCTLIVEGKVLFLLKGEK